MYKQYFRLHEEPFNLTPDPRFLFLTAQHREALNHLLYGVRQRKGFICLTGEVGTGKTTLCRALLSRLGPGCRTALILNPVLTNTQLLAAILEEFGLEVRGDDVRLDQLRRLNRFLLRANGEGEDAVLIIDEAQDMPVRGLEMVRLLSNLETARQKLLQIVLVGQPELRDKLAQPCLRQLNQRITVRYHLRQMTRQDTEQYLRHRLRVAGANGWPRFERRAIRTIHRLARGTPRLVNALGDKALLAGYAFNTGRISRKMVKLAARDLDGMA